MRVQAEEWRRFIPGVRMYKGKKTLFFNGEKLFNVENLECLVYDWEERQTWEVIIVLPGVEVIPHHTFYMCHNVKTVIMADSVRRMKKSAFKYCKNLIFVKLSRTLQFIGVEAFWYCESLTSIFIPPSCREIGRDAFRGCKELIISNVPQTTELGESIINKTALIRASPFETNHHGEYDGNDEEVNAWIKNVNGDDEQYALHRACLSYQPNHRHHFRNRPKKGSESFSKEEWNWY